MREHLFALIDKSKLSRIKKELKSLVKPSIRIRTKHVKEERIPIGESKIGGLPDLPTGQDWPYWENIPLSFLAQFNLSQITKYDEEGLLPQKGVLYIFYETYKQLIYRLLRFSAFVNNSSNPLTFGINWIK